MYNIPITPSPPTPLIPTRSLVFSTLNSSQKELSRKATQPLLCNCKTPCTTWERHQPNEKNKCFTKTLNCFHSTSELKWKIQTLQIMRGTSSTWPKTRQNHNLGKVHDMFSLEKPTRQQPRPQHASTHQPVQAMLRPSTTHKVVFSSSLFSGYDIFTWYDIALGWGMWYWYFGIGWVYLSFLWRR